MIGRTAAVMATYVAVGMLLAVSMPVRPDNPRTPAVVALPMASTSSSTATTTVEPGPRAEDNPVVPRRSAVPSAGWQSASRVSELALSAEVPVRIVIPSLDVNAEIVQSGVDPVSNQMAIPPTPDVVGWYRFGPRPGEAGSAVLAGHVDMAGHGPGAFFELDRLQPGHRVVLQMSDGSTLDFEVVDTDRVPKAELDVDAVFDNAGPARVTLVTCGGAFNHTERTYLDNVVSHLRPVIAPS